MLKNILDLGETLNKSEQKSIRGGVTGPCGPSAGGRQCVPKPNYIATCVADGSGFWCDYTYSPGGGA